MSFPYGKAITLVARVKGPPDALGNDTWTTTTVDVVGAFAPGGSVEQVQGQDVITTQPAVYLLPGTAVAAVDAVVVDGVTYEVDGVPQEWDNPFTGHRFGVEVRLRSVTG